jgi:hypothetical protein
VRISEIRNGKWGIYAGIESFNEGVTVEGVASIDNSRARSKLPMTGGKYTVMGEFWRGAKSRKWGEVSGEGTAGLSCYPEVWKQY